MGKWLMVGSEPHRVVHLSSVHPADDVRILVKECRSLARAGYDLTLIARAEGDFSAGAVRVRSIGPMRGGRPLRMTLGIARVFRMALEERGDIYHFHDSELIPVGLLLRLMRRRVIYDAHEDLVAQIQTKKWLPKQLRPIVARVAGQAERMSSRFMSHVIVANPLQASRFPTERTACVQNFPTLSELRRIDHMEQGSENHRVFYVGGLSAIRGIWSMVRAIELVNRQRNVTLRLGGDFSTAELHHEVSKASGWNHTVHLGRISRDQVFEELSQAQAGLVVVQPVPNYMTNQPVKLFEYMMAGVPVIASDFPNYRQFVDDVGSGIMVDPTDPQKIASAILWIIEHSDEARQMGLRGRQAILERFNWESQAQILLDVYKTVLEEPR